MSLNISESLQTLAQCFLQAEGESDEQLQQRLMTLGLVEAEARQWALLMPLAFARAAYRFQLPQLADEQNQYVQCLLSGEKTQGVEPHVMKLDQLAPYILAHAWACDCGQMDTITSPEYNAIVRRSVDFEAIQSLRAGAIETLPPLMLAF